MHELSIAVGIVDLAGKEAERCGVSRVLAVNLRLGRLAGVAKDALLFSYKLACENTLLAGSELVIEEVPGLIFCETCGENRPAGPREWFRCCECHALASEIVQGKELELVSLEVEA